MCTLGLTPVVMTWVREAAGGVAADLPRKQELDVIGPPEVEILANDRFEEFAPAERPVEDLGETDFRLENRELIGKAARPHARPSAGGGSAAASGQRTARSPRASSVSHTLLQRVGSGARRESRCPAP